MAGCAMDAVAGLFHVAANASGGVAGGENAGRDSGEDDCRNAANQSI